jgi:hypothetical protein
METIPENEIQTAKPPIERLAYSVQEAADMLGVHYFSIYRLIQRGKLKTCRALPFFTGYCRDRADLRLRG